MVGVVQTLVCEAGFQGIVLSTMKLGLICLLMCLLREDACCGETISWGSRG